MTTAAMTTPVIIGYRDVHSGLLRGHWLRGELLAAPLTDWPVLAEPLVIAPADQRSGQRLYVVPDTAFLRYVELDWIHRRARVEIGLREGTADQAGSVLEQALSLGFGVLGLKRLYGWATPAADAPTALLEDAGFHLEATVPRSTWFAGRAVERQIWGALTAPDKTLPDTIPPSPPRHGPAAPDVWPTAPQIHRVSASDAAARLRGTDGRCRGFLGLDPVTQNDAAIVASLTARGAMVWSHGDTLLGAYPNPDNPRQAYISTTSADPGALASLAELLRIYRRHTSMIAATTRGEPAATALRECGFEPAGVLRRHYYRSGEYHDVHLHYAPLEQPCA